MTDLATAEITAIRAFNRFYTRHLGVLADGYLQSEYTLTEARVLFEIGAGNGSTTATDLQATLGHNAGYLSRVLRRLQELELVYASPSPRDGRERLLSLTERGQTVMDELDQRSHHQIAADLERLSPAHGAALVRAMRTVHELLAADREPDETEITLRPHRPGDIGWIVQRHGEIYTEEFGWTSDFEGVVAEIGAAFLLNHDAMRDRCWIAEWRGERVGTITLVRHPERDGVAKLRLLLVDPAARGLGLGRRLVAECLAFARAAGYHTITLWTMNRLTGARHIYTAAGFRLIAAEPVHVYGHAMTSETWELTL